MTDEVFSGFGGKVYISNGQVASTVDSLAEFQALSWIEITPVESVGGFGDQANAVTFNALDQGRIIKKKGSKDAGTVDITVAYNQGNTGQAQIRTADASNNDWGFKIEYNDASEGSPSQNTEFYFRGHVLGFKQDTLSNDNILKAVAQVAINSAIVENPRV